MIFKALDTQEEWDWFHQRTHVLRCEDSQGIVVLESPTGPIAAIAVFDSFTRDNGCNVHMAIDNPLVLRYKLLEEIARHLFITCGLRRLFGLVPANNEKALKLNRHIGMTEVARIPHGVAEGVDYIVLCLERTECRWIPEEFREAA